LEYSLDSNEELNRWVLSSNELTKDANTFVETISNSEKNTTSLSEVLSSNLVQYAGFPLQPTKEFRFDEKGVYVQSENSRDYVLSREELEIRLPHYEYLLSDEEVKPKVVGLHAETLFMQPDAKSRKSQKHYFLIIRSGEWRDSRSGFEIIFSMPEN